MKKLFIAIALSLSATVVYAACSTNTIVNRDGTVTTCTTCCYGPNCTTNCF